MEPQSRLCPDAGNRGELGQTLGDTVRQATVGFEAPCFQNLNNRRSYSLADAGDFAEPASGRDFNDSLRVKTERLGGSRERSRAKWTLAGDLQEAAVALQDVGYGRVGGAGRHDARAAVGSFRIGGGRCLSRRGIRLTVASGSSARTNN